MSLSQTVYVLITRDSEVSDCDQSNVVGVFSTLAQAQQCCQRLKELGELNETNPVFELTSMTVDSVTLPLINSIEFDADDYFCTGHLAYISSHLTKGEHTVPI